MKFWMKSFVGYIFFSFRIKKKKRFICKIKNTFSKLHPYFMAAREKRRFQLKLCQLDWNESKFITGFYLLSLIKLSVSKKLKTRTEPKKIKNKYYSRESRKQMKGSGFKLYFVHNERGNISNFHIFVILGFILIVILFASKWQPRRLLIH